MTFRWEAIDRHRRWTVLAAAGLAAGIALAILGLPPVDWHGPLHRVGIMDPLPGATRGVRLTLRGDLPAAWRYNPAAPLLVIVALLVLVRAMWGWLTHRWLTVRLTPTRAIVVPLVVAVVALWANQQAHAPLLIARV